MTKKVICYLLIKIQWTTSCPLEANSLTFITLRCGLERMVVACNRQRAALVQHSVVKPRSEVRSEAGKPHCSHRPRFQTLALDRRGQAPLERIIFRCGNSIRCRPRKHQPRAHEEKRHFGKVFLCVGEDFSLTNPTPLQLTQLPHRKGDRFSRSFFHGRTDGGLAQS